MDEIHTMIHYSNKVRKGHMDVQGRVASLNIIREGSTEMTFKYKLLAVGFKVPLLYFNPTITRPQALEGMASPN